MNGNNTIKSQLAFRVDHPNVAYLENSIEAKYTYNRTTIVKEGESYVARPVDREYTFVTNTVVPRVGLMMAGWGGNNGTTLTASVLALKHKLSFQTKEGEVEADLKGSFTQSATCYVGQLGTDQWFVPVKQMLPMVEPEDLVLGGWDISSLNLGEATRRAKVLDWSLQEKLRPLMSSLKPLKAAFVSDFVAANQSYRADNCLEGSKQEMVEQLRRDISNFKETNGLDKVIVFWTANTERFSDVREGLNTTWAELEASIKRNESEVSSSTLYGVASILEGSIFLNGSPQNTFVPGLLELAKLRGVPVGGDDLKTGQTRVKSVLADFLVSCGLQLKSVVSYNHLGNNDGHNLNAPKQFRSKEISKKNVIDDMVESNHILYKGRQDYPDHSVVIKYSPFVGDSKRAMDEYISQLMFGGLNTISTYNMCEDSLLAAPIMLDIVILAELFSRIHFGDHSQPHPFHPISSALSFFFKAPLVPLNTPLVNALFSQKNCIVNILRACHGLDPVNNMHLEYKIL